MKRFLAVLAVAMILASTSALACDGSGKTRADGSKPASERQT
jgi:hypothetical protein